jgi:hypothetical protein
MHSADELPKVVIGQEGGTSTTVDPSVELLHTPHFEWKTH